MNGVNIRRTGIPATINGKSNPAYVQAFQLTLQQHRVCELVALGLSNKEIAAEMGIGSRTVESHRELIFKKMGVRNAVEMVRKVLGVSE